MGSYLGFGCVYFVKEIFYLSINKLIEMVIDKGIRYFDVVFFYGRGIVEYMLGKVLKNYCNEVIIVIKVGIVKVVDFDLKLIVRLLLFFVRLFFCLKKRNLLINYFRIKMNFDINFVDNSIYELLLNLEIDFLDILFLYMVCLEDINDDLLIYFEKIKSLGVVNKIGIVIMKEDSIEINNEFLKFFDVN